MRSSKCFAIPAELRNEIYELTAAQSTMRLEPSMRDDTRGRIITSPPGVLLSSKQVRVECKTILMSQSRVAVVIEAVDIFELDRPIDTISTSDFEALTADPKLSL